MWVFIIIIGLLLALLAVGFLIGNMYYKLALSRHTDKSEVFDAPHNRPDRKPEESEKERLRAWHKGFGPQQVTAVSFDGLRLCACLYEQKEPSHNWVIAAHGYMGTHRQMLGVAEKFCNKGFHVLAPDARGCGESEGHYLGMGWYDRLDILTWIREIENRDPAAKIILYGVSMGGATVMMAAGEDLPPSVAAIVEDCGYSSVYDEFSYQLKQMYGLPSFPILNLAGVVTKIRAGYDIKKADAAAQVAKSKTPILFIHGKEDKFVPVWMMDVVYKAATCQKEKMIVEGAGHGEAARVGGEAYWQTIWDFIGQFV